MLQYLVFLGAGAQLFGAISYARETLRGDNKPNKVTWLMWAVAPIIATAAAISDGVGWAVLPVFMAGFGPLLVFLSSFVNPNAYWKLERFDYICGACSVLALVLWGITREPLVAIVFAIVSDGFAAVPTLIKLWKYPETESVAPFTTGLFSSLTSFAALRTFGFSEIAFPAYLAVINIALIAAFYRKKILG